MDFSKALDKTLDKFGVTGKWLSAQSGVSERMISNFRNGKQRVWSDSLERIISALPTEPKQYLFAQLLDSSTIPLHFQIEDIVRCMDLMQVSQLMGLLGQIIAEKSRKSAESPHMAVKL